METILTKIARWKAKAKEGCRMSSIAAEHFHQAPEAAMEYIFGGPVT